MLRAIFGRIIKTLYPSRCPYCNEFILYDDEACEACIDKLEYEYIITPLNCESRNVSPFKYDGLYRDAILSLKYADNPQFAQQLAISVKKAVCKEYSDFLADENNFDIIACVPCTKSDYKKRGYNQAQLIAEALSKELSIPFEQALQKAVKTKPQHTMQRSKRQANVIGAFAVNQKSDVTGKRILLIDDIVTTGSTLSECAKTLYKAGAETVLCATYATTPPKNDKL